MEKAATAQPPALTVMIERQKPEIERALPAHLKVNTDAFVRAALTTVKQTKGLMECEPSTVLGGIMTASALGLEFGPLSHCYLLPFDDRKAGTKKAQFILGFKGMIDLAWRSGRLKSIEAHEVYAEDEFEFEYGLNPKLVHKPTLDGRAATSKPIAYYGVAHFKDGGYYFLVMPRAEIEAHRQRSKSKERGPWVTDYDAMARKTCIRAMAPFLPLTSEIERELALDGVVATTAPGAGEVQTENVEWEVADPSDTDDEPVDAEIVES